MFKPASDDDSMKRQRLYPSQERWPGTMTMKIEPTLVLKDPSCQNRECPTLIETEDAFYAIGTTVSAEELAAVDAAARANNSGVGAGEGVLRLPKSLIAAFRAHDAS